MKLSEIGLLIKQYRVASGLSQSELAALASISRATLISLENGQLQELGATKLFGIMDVLGIQLNYSKNMLASDESLALKKAVASANVSYSAQLSPALLEQALLEGKVLQGYEGNLLHFIDELPTATILGVIRAVAVKTNTKPKQIWRKALQLALQMQSPRRLWYVAG